ncbi:ABC transporter permease subunit [Natrialba sp. SSL1]|uniref:ABC transporter permease subunit n=1 Tax=Natrialba sp. SSL1 TaxID=1869245 RepID=UPI0008F89A02|nr:ABC transporter permease subunit [Natrialba sp. SSL1]OIB58960.1 ABC transporter [Natrialba sp. SSL1]
MSSHVGAVARKDFADASRSRLLWSIIGLLVALTTIGYVAVWAVTDDTSASEMLGFVALPLSVLLPVAALIVGYMAVVGERQSGSLKLLLGLPPNRGDVVFGKLLGRIGVISVAVVLSFLVALVLSIVLFGSLPISDWLAFGAISLLFGLTFVALAVGVSAGVSSRGRSMAIAIGTYLLFVGLWELVTAGPYYVIHDETPPVEAETWYLFVQQFNPLQAYATISSEVVEGDVFPFMFQYGLEPFEAQGMAPAERVSGEAPFYLQEWFGGIAMLIWALIPVLIGYYRFQRTDL